MAVLQKIPLVAGMMQILVLTSPLLITCAARFLPPSYSMSTAGHSQMSLNMYIAKLASISRRKSTSSPR